MKEITMQELQSQHRGPMFNFLVDLYLKQKYGLEPNGSYLIDHSEVLPKKQTD
jgi:hypothetical protein